LRAWSEPTVMSSSAPIVIRKIESLAEMRDVEQLQREIWGVEDLDVYPALALRPQTEVGGILIGAFAADRLVGFVFGFPGILNGETIIHSDMLGVSELYRSQSLGYLLKLAQREEALALGIKRITWTFDPLQARNAHLNFSKLGVIADRYYVDYYGVTSSFLHRFGTDRLWVTWLLDKERVQATLLNDLDQLSHLVRVGEGLEPITDKFTDEPRLVIEIPGELDANQQRWREATRTAFTHALDQGYVAEEFYVSERAGQKVGRYILRASASDIVGAASVAAPSGK
jgi:predicted GNAT superfamily acetyltransferase